MYSCNSLMFEELDTADVTLACDDDERIQAHKLIITNLFHI